MYDLCAVIWDPDWLYSCRRRRGPAPASPKWHIGFAINLFAHAPRYLGAATHIPAALRNDRLEAICAESRSKQAAGPNITSWRRQTSGALATG